MKKLTLLIAASLLLGGCAFNMGSQSVNDFGRFIELKKGQSDKSTIFQQFGQPHEVTYVAETGESIWSYFNIKESMNAMTLVPFLGLVAGGNDVNSTRADFYFDPKGIFLKSERSEKSSYQNQWVGMAKGFERSHQFDRVRKEMKDFNLPFDEKLARQNAANANVSGH